MALEIPAIVKEKWPLFLGGAVGLFFVVRYIGGAGAPAATDNYAGYLASQSAAQVAANQAAVQQDANTMAYNLQSASIASQTQDSTQKNYAAFVAAQGTVAQGVAAAAAGVINALNLPAQQAIASGSAENEAALNAAATVAVGGFNAQAYATQSTASIVESVSKVPFATQAADVALSQNQQPSIGSQLIGAGATLGAAYFTGGASLAAQGALGAATNRRGSGMFA